MSTEFAYSTETGSLARKLAHAARPSASLFVALFAASDRLRMLGQTGKTSRLDRLVVDEAWCDAALELLPLEAPLWSIQRLCRDNGEWLCTLTRFPELPDWLDDSAEGRHSDMALAILGALLELRARAASARQPQLPQVLGTVADCADYR